MAGRRSGHKPGSGRPNIDPHPPFSDSDGAYQRYETISEIYVRAREARMHLFADEIYAMADDSSNDWMDVETRSGRMVRVLDHEHVKRSEIRIKTRQWLMSRFAPRVYGERVQLDAREETLDALRAKSDQQRLEEALELVRRAKERVA